MGATTSNHRFSVVVSDSSRMSCDLVAHALKHFAHDIVVVGAAASWRDLSEVIEHQQPEVAIISLDLEDGPGTGLVALRTLHARYPSLGCVVLMDSRSRHLVVDAFRAGARGVVFRTESPARLVESLRSVRSGNVWATSAEIDMLMNTLSTAVPIQAVTANGNELLTDRQKAVVALVAEGLSNREIAQQLRLSEHTVKNYLFRIFDKLGVSSRAELIIYTLHQQNRAA